MPLQATSGAASYDAFGGGVAAVPNYIEEVFATHLYTGNGSSQTITNGVDLSGEGGMVWIKQRSATRDNLLFDTTRGATQRLFSNLTLAQSADTQSLTSFNSDGFSVGSDSGANINAGTYVGWTFREQPKFFDVVTYTGNGTQGRSVSHNLGSAPGFMIVKRTDGVDNWRTYHRSLGGTKFMSLDTTAAAGTANTLWNDADPTSTVFYLGNDASVNGNGMSYVAYLFAHNAGGFGLTGTDNVISCGSFTTGAYLSVTTVNLGYEPQWLLVKSTADENWWLVDNMRGMPVGSVDATLNPNLSSAESLDYDIVSPTATGFTTVAGSSLSTSATYIYIAIRRGPMKVPTDGTKVFLPIASSASTGTTLTTGFPVDMQIEGYRAGTESGNWTVVDRLRSVSSTTTEAGRGLVTSDTAAENTYGNLQRNWSNTGFQFPSYWGGLSSIFYSFRRAPGFFDEVCYTGTGSARTVAHNLAAVPELMIVKSRSTAYGWTVYAAGVGNTSFAYLNEPDAFQTNGTAWNNTSPTSSVFTVGTGPIINASGSTFAAYLFASCPGVSKVFNYTGNGSSQTINCGFTGGARFVMIKRTDSTGDWYVWDSARGIVSGNDPRLSLNTTAAEVTTDDSVDTDSTGFVVNQLSATNINVSSATYIGIAIA